MRRIFKSPLFAVLMAAVLGYVSMTVTMSVVSPLLKGLVPADLVLLTGQFSLGVVLGFLYPRIWWVLALFTVSLPMAVAVVEMIFVSGSHNLWPLEFFYYGIAMLSALAGALIGRWIGKKKLRKSEFV